MADEVYILQSYPCHPNDFNTGRLRLPTKVIKRIGARINQPAKIRCGRGYVFCTVWPLIVDNCKLFQVDPFVILYEQQTKLTNTEEVSKLIIPRDICILYPEEAKEANVSVVLSSNGNLQARDFLQQQQRRREKKARTVLLGHCITAGCCITPRQFRNNFSSLKDDVEKIYISSVKPTSKTKTGEKVFIITRKTKIRVTSVTVGSEVAENKSFIIGGLDDAFETLYEMVKFPFLFPESFAHLALELPKGVLLQGAPGVGKTLLVRTVASKCNAQILTLNGTDVFGPHSGESEENLRKAFEKARIASKHSPCILFIDEIDALCPKRGFSGSEEENRIVAQLLTLMDGLETRANLIVIGATNRPNAIDPALRRPGRFDREVVIGTPTAAQRQEILKAHTKALPLAPDVDLPQLAEITVGYVGADLASLCREATLTSMRNALKMDTDKAEISNHKGRLITMSDFQLSMCHIVPSTYRGIQELVDVRQVDWSSIGGLHDVKFALQQAVEWPLLYPEAFSRMGLKRPQGVLLYGPPGCCKTTLVRAAATSCRCTFLSLNCAQLYSPHVGDAERTVREVFTKARATAPSILFLDELDSLAGKREDKSTGSGVEARILATLLNEMDGVGISANIYTSADKLESNRTDEKELLVLKSSQKEDSLAAIQENKQRLRDNIIRDVLVVAATNRPDAIDGALLRPGRCDRMIYVPPPDLEARLEILKIYTRSSPLDNDVDLDDIAVDTEMYSGADIENLCREAALYSLQEKGMMADSINHRHFTQALVTVKPSLTQSQLDSYKRWTK